MRVTPDKVEVTFTCPHCGKVVTHKADLAMELTRTWDEFDCDMTLDFQCEACTFHVEVTLNPW